MTKREGEDHFDFCRRAAEHPVGREIKRADLEDNLNVMRLQPELTEWDLERLKRYRQAWELLRPRQQAAPR